MLVIGIAGGSGSGKSTVVRAIKDRLEGEKVIVIPQDSYYKDISDASDEEKRHHNFDHPDSIDWDLLCQHLKQLESGQDIEQPKYSYISCSRSKTDTVHVYPADVVIVEGILVFTCKELLEQMDIKIFVDADADERLMRMILRDINERGKDVRWVMERYVQTVKPMYNLFIEPSKEHADIIVPKGGFNQIAIDFLVARIEKVLASKE